MKKPSNYNPLSPNVHSAAKQLLAEAVETQCYSVETRCWEIPLTVRCRNESGYTRARFRGVAGRAHRIVNEAHYGPFTDKAPCGLHKCDNPACIRPLHLFRGTRADNTRDMMQKGRQRPGIATGESHGNCKLSDIAVLNIHHMRAAGLTQMKIAAVVGVSGTHISRILSGKSRPDIHARYHQKGLI